MKPSEFLTTDHHAPRNVMNVVCDLGRPIVDAGQRLVLGYRIPSTCHTAEDYHRMLFPDIESFQAMLEYVRTRNVLDLGSGTTHLSPYSLMNVVERESNGMHSMVGVDPRTAYPIGHERGISHMNIRIQRKIDAAVRKVRERSGLPVYADTPAENAVRPDSAEDLKFPDASFNQVLSSFLYPWWITREKLAPILSEVTRVLSPGGQFRFAPVPGKKMRQMKKDPAISSLLEEHYDNVAITRPTGGFVGKWLGKGWPTMILTKRN